MSQQIQDLVQELKSASQQVQTKLNLQKENQKKCLILQIPVKIQVKILVFLDQTELQYVNLTCIQLKNLIGNRYLNLHYTRQLSLKIQKIKESYEQKQITEEEDKSITEIKNMDKDQLVKEVKKLKVIIDRVAKTLKTQDLIVKQKDEEIISLQNQLRVSQNLQMKYQQKVQDLQSQSREVQKEHQNETMKLENEVKIKKLDVENLQQSLKQITDKVKRCKEKKQHFKQELQKDKKETWKLSEQNLLFKKAFAQLKNSFCTYSVPAFEKILQRNKEIRKIYEEQENEKKS